MAFDTEITLRTTQAARRGFSMIRPRHDGLGRVKLLILLLVLLPLPLVWRWTPLYEWFNLETILRWQESIGSSPWAPVCVAAAYLVGSLLFFPVTILNLATVFAFGPILGNLYAVAGWMLSSAEGYLLGRLVGQKRLHRLAGPRLEPLLSRAENHAFWTVLGMRIAPVGPFTLVNIFIGASGIPFIYFITASLIGRLPGVVSLTLFGTQLEMALRKPGLTGFALLIFVLVAVPLATAALTKRVAARRRG